MRFHLHGPGRKPRAFCSARRHHAFVSSMKPRCCTAPHLAPTLGCRCIWERDGTLFDKCTFLLFCFLFHPIAKLCTQMLYVCMSILYDVCPCSHLALHRLTRCSYPVVLLTRDVPRRVRRILSLGSPTGLWTRGCEQEQMINAMVKKEGSRRSMSRSCRKGRKHTRSRPPFLTSMGQHELAGTHLRAGNWLCEES